MIPNTKISQTILEFGKSLILALPPNHSKDEFEAAITIVITTWNAVVMDSWDDKTNLSQSFYLQYNQLQKKRK